MSKEDELAAVEAGSGDPTHPKQRGRPPKDKIKAEQEIESATPPEAYTLPLGLLQPASINLEGAQNSLAALPPFIGQHSGVTPFGDQHVSAPPFAAHHLAPMPFPDQHTSPAFAGLPAAFVTAASGYGQPPADPTTLISPASAPKKRGRPKGSKNKPKPVPGEEQQLNSMASDPTYASFEAAVMEASAPSAITTMKKRGRPKGSKNKPKPEPGTVLSPLGANHNLLPPGMPSMGELPAASLGSDPQALVQYLINAQIEAHAQAAALGHEYNPASILLPGLDFAAASAAAHMPLLQMPLQGMLAPQAPQPLSTGKKRGRPLGSKNKPKPLAQDSVEAPAKKKAGRPPQKAEPA